MEGSKVMLLIPMNNTTKDLIKNSQTVQAILIDQDYLIKKWHKSMQTKILKTIYKDKIIKH